MTRESNHAAEGPMSASVIIPKRTLRSPAYLAAMLTSGNSSQTATIRNVSHAGALLEVECPLPVGTPVEVVCADEMAVKCRVVWTDSLWLGVEFDDPLEGGVLVDHMRSHVKVSAPRLYRRGPARKHGDND